MTRRAVALFLALALLLPCAFAAEDARTQTQQVVSAQAEHSFWEMLSLTLAGEALPQAEIDAYYNETVAAQGVFRLATDLSCRVLLLSALGYDAKNIGGVDLIALLQNHARMTNQGVNGPIFALIALDSLNYADIPGAKWDRSALISAILSAQNADGGVALSAGESSGVDLTAMALCALSGHTARPNVANATERMLAYLSAAQRESGGFSLYGSENCESAAQVILALRAMKIAPDDARFVKNGHGVRDALDAFRLANGAYCHVQGGRENRMATEQALLALLAEEREGALYRLPARTFRDEAEIAPWAHDAVLRVAASGIMQGDGGAFLPRRALTRAEMAQILARALELSGTEAAFSDVRASDWYFSAVAAVCERGLMRGSGGTFRPSDTITREELAVVLARAAGLSGTAEISDLAAVSPWARDAVQAVYHAGIMRGSSGAFHPNDTVTREMAATVVARIWEE